MRIVVFPLVWIFSCNSFPFRLRLEFAAFVSPGYVFFKVDGYSDQDVLNEANELYKALRSDYELLEAEQERREQEPD